MSKAEGEQGFFNRLIPVEPDVKPSQREFRRVALGQTNVGRLLSVVFTVRDASSPRLRRGGSGRSTTRLEPRCRTIVSEPQAVDDANAKDAPYQSLLKVFLAYRLARAVPTGLWQQSRNGLFRNFGAELRRTWRRRREKGLTR